FFSFSVFYAIFVPSILFVIDRLLPYRDRYENYDKHEWIRLGHLRERAIVESNSIIYSYCEKKIKEIEKAALARKFSIAVMILLVIEVGFSISTDRLTMLNQYINFFENNVVIGTIIGYCLIGSSFVLITNIIDNEDIHSKRVYLPDYSSRSVEQWLAEINSGLIPKDKAFYHFNKIERQGRGYPEVLRYDRKNDSHVFLRESGLIKIIKNKIHVTPKGKFISQFKDLHKEDDSD
ncbi:MAG: hypothetical protein OQJ89_05955, partial [Kangiellaceae bacterium]|nr:hypothetical protein [Kangiellaceae bacterium]